MRKFWSVMLGVLLAAGLLPASAAHAAQAYHLRSVFVSLGGEDRATLLGPDLLAGHFYFHVTYSDCATFDCNEMGKWYVIDHDGSQLGGTWVGGETPCLGPGGDLVVNWGFGKYEGVHGGGRFSVNDTFAVYCAAFGGGGPWPVGWSGDLTLNVSY